MSFFAASEAPPRPESMKFSVFSLLAGNLAFSETSSQLTPPWWREGASDQDRRNRRRGAGRWGNLPTRKRVQKLQMALHAKAKAEAGYRFYALYDKISREDILVHAYAQCRSNKGAPGVDGQDFADIDAYGVERWLAELALALREETYRPEPDA